MTFAAPARGGARRFLNAGSGFRTRAPTAPFDATDWMETTVDVDPATEPDVVCSLVDMRAALPDGSFDAVLSSHSLEHLYGFEVVEALREFRRVLRPDGFALVTCPDLDAVAAAVSRHGLGHVAYVAPAGPITLHDMIFGHSRSIQDGVTAMAHRTGFTARSLGEVALEAGFPEVAVGPGNAYDLWGVFGMPETDHAGLAALLARTSAAGLWAPTTAGDGR
ncbi:class I SAM-dependent methyltransferase [Lichenibacterium ramalinae]|uniref:SAM-dependent methyltransferase n=1 Tax=Lichenibacterium ramalinae TaxID=2316527 RepID=A0A4Q2RC62_9HYPH|nr:methyltransferase domain-containing protein [Lichenibacterium ramalinae]RYB02590.1 SAM-dependent methyltransferase [Lichenibacterium ramalinae]